MEIKNIKVYGLEESIIRSGYPMLTGTPPDLFATSNESVQRYLDISNNIGKDVERIKRLSKAKMGNGHDNALKGIIVQFDILYP